MFESPSLNPFLAMGRPAWSAVRSWLVELLEHEGYRMAHDSPRHWAEGQELLAFLDLG